MKTIIIILILVLGFSIVTTILYYLNLNNVIDWSWKMCFLPLIIIAIFGFLVLCAIGAGDDAGDAGYE